MKIRLSSVLLFVLVIPFIMMYRISPGETPFWLFSLVFLLLFGYVLIDYLKFSERLYYKLKNIVLWVVIALTIGAAFYSVIVVRHKVAPVYNVHDIILQQESAVNFLVHGKNPYATSYFGTPMESFHYSDTEVNPALYYFVMEPLYVISAVPFYVGMVHTIGYFDARLPLFVLFFVGLIVFSSTIKEKEDRLLALTLFAFNPAQLGYTLEGRSDAYVLGFLVIALVLLYKRKFGWGGVFMALAFCVKQSVWPIMPFYVAYLYFVNKSVKKTILNLIPFTVINVLIILPFFLWNQKAFIDSTIGYLSGSVPHSYPIAGYGFGMLLNSLGIIRDVHSYYPFAVWQIIVCLPLLGYFLFLQKKDNTFKTLILLYALLLFVFWYFSRYFNNSHLGYISMLLILSYFWPLEHSKKT